MNFESNSDPNFDSMNSGLYPRKTYSISVLGCRTNQYEAQAMKDQLEAMGYVLASEGEAADISIVNTCTVTEGADSSSRHAVRSLAKKSPNGKLIVTGCLAERERDKLYSIPGVTKIVPNMEKELLVAGLFPEEIVPEFAIKQFEAHTRAFVKVQDGCNSFCTYCIIPYVRGRSRSRPVDDIIRECEGLVAAGYQEIVLTGINIGDFDGGGAEAVRLATLIRAVDALPGLKRLRVSSIDPDEVDDDLLDAIMNGRTTCHSMHIVLQSGSNAILKRMNRKYTRQVFLETVRRLVDFDPYFTCTTDVIVGFPGETEVDFFETLDVIEQVQFAKVHMFPYSPRPRTRAALYKDQIPHDIIQARKALVLSKAEEAAFSLRKKYVGEIVDVLTESKDRDSSTIFGHTSHFIPVHIDTAAASIEENQIITARVVENRPDGLYAKIV